MSLIGDIGGAIVGFLFQGIHDMLYGLVNGLLSLLVGLLAYNPDVTAVHNVWSDVAGIMTSLYVLVLILGGIAILLGSIMGSDPDRLVKEWVVKSFVGLILVNCSFELYELILELEEAMVKEVFVNVDLSGFIVAGAVSILILLIDFSLLLGVVLVLIIRNILVLMGCVFFPIIIFLYLLPPARRIGNILLTLTFMVIFLPFVRPFALESQWLRSVQ